MNEDMILMKEQERVVTIKDLMKIQDEKELFEARVKIAIFNELNSAGKPMFSNEFSRDAEFIVRTRDDLGWKALREREMSMLGVKMMLECAIDYEKRKFEVMLNESNEGVRK